jgi:hypothetical protein
MLIQYLLNSTYIVLEYTNTVIHTKGKKQCSLEMKIGTPFTLYSVEQTICENLH